MIPDPTLLAIGLGIGISAINLKFFPLIRISHSHKLSITEKPDRLFGDTDSLYVILLMLSELTDIRTLYLHDPVQIALGPISINAPLLIAA